MALDPRIEKVRVEYGLARDDFWELPQKKGTWVAKHAALEAAAAKAGIQFDMPQIIEANSETKTVSICVRGALATRSEWSFGEAAPANNKNSYPYAMAEKRGKDRVILKLIGLHGLAYSEDEADDFKQGQAVHPTSAPLVGEDPDVIDGVKNWLDKQRVLINAATRLPDLYMWLDANGTSLTDPDNGSNIRRLQMKAPAIHKELCRIYQAKVEQLQKQKVTA